MPVLRISQVDSFVETDRNIVLAVAAEDRNAMLAIILVDQLQNVAAGYVAPFLDEMLAIDLDLVLVLKMFEFFLELVFLVFQVLDFALYLFDLAFDFRDLVLAHFGFHWGGLLTARHAACLAFIFDPNLTAGPSALSSSAC
jgi:hypothetical protein